MAAQPGTMLAAQGALNGMADKFGGRTPGTASFAFLVLRYFRQLLTSSRLSRFDSPHPLSGQLLKDVSPR